MHGRQQIEINLRPWSEADLTLLQQLMGDPAMTEHIGGPETPEKIRKRHERYYQGSDSDRDRMFVILVGSEKLAAGSIGYWEKTWQGQTIWETGWSVLPEFQGKGIATKAATAVLELARAAGMHRFIHAFPSIDNPSSNAICLKAGFTRHEQVDFEYPPGQFMRCNNWQLDLLAT